MIDRLYKRLKQEIVHAEIKKINLNQHTAIIVIPKDSEGKFYYTVTYQHGQFTSTYTEIETVASSTDGVMQYFYDVELVRWKN